MAWPKLIHAVAPHTARFVPECARKRHLLDPRSLLNRCAGWLTPIAADSALRAEHEAAG